MSRSGVTIARTVLYRSRTDHYTIPAIVAATRDTLYRSGVALGHVPDLHDDDNVHLVVLTPGIPGFRLNRAEFVARADDPIADNVGGVYQEWDVPFWEPNSTDVPFWNRGALSLQAAGTWAWPPRAR